MEIREFSVSPMGDQQHKQWWESYKNKMFSDSV